MDSPLLLIMIKINILLLRKYIRKFYCKISQSKFGSKSDIVNLAKKTDLDKNELNELSTKVKAISTKGLTKDLINKFIILNGSKYFSSRIFQNYLVFIPAKK